MKSYHIIIKLYLKSFKQLILSFNNLSCYIKELYNFFKSDRLVFLCIKVIKYFLQFVKKSSRKAIIIVDIFDEYILIIKIYAFLSTLFDFFNIKILLTTYLHEVDIINEMLPSIFITIMEIRISTENLKAFISAK